MSRVVRRFCTFIAILICVALALNGQALACATASPSSLSFPDTVIPYGSSSQVVMVKNDSGQTITFGAITASQNFSVSLNQCGATLANGASCKVYVRFNPTTAGDLTGTLTINEMTPLATETVALSGKGVSGGIPLNPTSLSFPDATLPAGTSSQVVNLTNLTGQTMTFGSITASANFAVSLNQCGASLAPLASCKIYVRFAPSVAGSLTGALTINETSPDGSQTVQLSGNALSGGIPFSPGSLTFPDTTLPAGTSSQVINLTNYTGQTVSFSSITASTNFAVSLNQCGTSLAPLASCKIYVRFAPTVAGSLTGALTISETSPAGSQTINLSGKASGQIPVSPASLSFPDTILPAGSSSQVVNVTNYTGQTLTFGSITASPNFAVSLNQCGTSLAPNTSCKIYVRFAPAAAGALNGTLTINETDPAGVQTVSLSGKSTGQIPVSPASLSFADTTLPGSTSSQVVNITNWSGQALTFGQITASDNFTVSLNQCGTTLAEGTSCKIYVRFSPTTAGDLTGSLTINETDPVGVQTVSLSGTAIGGGVQFSTTSLNFPNTAIGSSSAAQAVVLKNYTGQPLTASATIAGDFSVALNTCTDVAQGGSCQIYVQFNPTSAGKQNDATLTINYSTGTQVVSLGGLGFETGKAPLLQVQVKDSPASVNLSPVDADHPANLDWIVWSADASKVSTRKAGANLIIDDGAFNAPDLDSDQWGYIKFSWTGGTTVPLGDNVQPEMYTLTSNGGFQLRVPADSTARTLKIYTWAYGTATIEASMDDGSGLNATDSSVISTQEVEKTYSIDYRSVAPATLTVRISVNFPEGNPGGIALQAAALQPYVPSVSMNSPINGQSFTTPDGITPADIPVSVQAVPLNSAVSQVAVTLDPEAAGPTLLMNSAPYSSVFSSVYAGHHVLAAKAIDQAGLVGLADPVEIDVLDSAGTGTLTATVEHNVGPSVSFPSDLTDWVVWKYNQSDSSVTLIRKAGVTQQMISDYTILGNHPLTYYECGGGYLFSFMDGDSSPAAQSDVPAKACVDGPGNGFELTVNADQNPRQLRLYVGADFGKAKLTAFFNDGSAPPVVSEAIDEPGQAGTSTNGNQAYLINLKAGSPNRRLTIRFTLETAYSSVSSADYLFGEVILYAATLQ